MNSHLSKRYFGIEQEYALSDLKENRAEVPQGRALGPVLYLLNICDLPELENNLAAAFADDTGILSVGKNNEQTAHKL